MTPKQQAWYDRELAAFAAANGRRYFENVYATVTATAAKLGISVEQLLNDLNALVPLKTDAVANIRHSYQTAFAKFGNQTFHPSGCHRFTPKPKRTPPPDSPHKYLVHDLVRAGGDTAAVAPSTFNAFTPFDPAEYSAAEQTINFLEWGWKPDDLLFITTKADGVDKSGYMGANIRPAAHWVAALKRGDEIPGDIIGVNPFSGRADIDALGNRSYIRQSCLVAPFPYIIMELDDLQPEEQMAFWLGVIRQRLDNPICAKLHSRLYSLVFSGGRSIHALLHSPRTADSWKDAAYWFESRFAVDEDKRYRIDLNALGPITKARIPQVTRIDNGEMQRLLYLNPFAGRGDPEN